MKFTNETFTTILCMLIALKLIDTQKMGILDYCLIGVSTVYLITKTSHTLKVC